MFFNNKYISDIHSYKYKNVEKVYESETSDKIMMEAESQQGNRKEGVILCESKDKNAVFYIEEVSRNKKWVTVLSQTLEEGAPRAKTDFLVFSTFQGKNMKDDLEKVIGTSISGPFSLDYKDNKLYLHFYFTDTNTEGKIELE